MHSLKKCVHLIACTTCEYVHKSVFAHYMCVECVVFIRHVVFYAEACLVDFLREDGNELDDHDVVF